MEHQANNSEKTEIIYANPTLVPRRAHSMEVVGKWTQIVRQSNVVAENQQQQQQQHKVL